MKSFKEYSKARSMDVATEGESKVEALDAEALTQKIAEAYHGKSNIEMLKGILSEAEKSKRAGTLSNAEIDAFYQSFAPMLDGVQKRKLCAVVERLKEIE